jgi:hypothetical protein
MSIHDVYDGAQQLCRTLRTLGDAQMTLSVGDDFAEYARIVKERDGYPLGLPFDPDQQDLGRGKGFWVVGRNPKGELVHTQAMRLIDLGAQSLAEYLRQNFHGFPPSGLPIDYANSVYNAGPGARRIYGRVAYHGEVWIRDDPAYRGRGLIDLVARFAFLSAAMNWSPDYVFGFIPRGTMRRGLAEREGYMHSDPFALSWRVDGRNQPIVGNLVWMALDDIRYVVNVPLDEVSAA